MIFLILSLVSVPDFSGVWQTTYGDMFLEQSGTEVTGWYSYGGMSSIEGTVDQQGRLVFTYDEGTATGEGWFQLSESGNSFEGEWRATGDRRWSSWEGHRSTGEASTWLVILETEWQESLTENEYSFGEMLAAWLGRLPDLQIRHRFVHDAEDVANMCAEAAMLPGDVYLVFASHGTEAGISLDGGTVTPRQVAQAVSIMPNLKLVHFSCCLIMAGGTDEAILSARNDWDEDFAVSGYTTSVDWGGSAIIEFYYLNQILENGMTPVQAAEALLTDIRFAGSRGTGYMDGAGFQINTP